MKDLRFAFRMLLKSPGFTAVAVLSLALGIGANTAMFCWMQSVVLRPWPGIARPEQMVVLCAGHGSTMWDTVSYPDLKDYATLNRVFAGIIGSQVTPACLSVSGQQEWIYGQIVTANYFDLLGVKTLLGRGFLPEEETGPGAHPVLVLSHGFWERRFARDPNILGRTVELNRHSFTIVGVAPPGFQGTMNGLLCDFWAPLMMHQQVANFGSLDQRADRWLHTQARLRPGVPRAQAQAAVATMARQLGAAYPTLNKEIDLRVLPPWQSPYGGTAGLLPVLRVLGAVSLGVLLIVAANIANLLLARATARKKEIAIRLALGASRARLIRQLLTESLVLALVGAAVGTLFSQWATGLLLGMIPNTYLPIGYQFRLDAQALGFTVLLALGAALLCGLAPALQATGAGLGEALKEGGRSSGAATPHHRLRSALVVSEMALALLLLVGAGLCIKGYQTARQIDPGFNPANVLLAGFRIGAHGYNEETGKAFYRRLQEQLATLPGVQTAALASWFPLGFEGGGSTTVEVAGYQRAPGEDTTVPYAIISPRYFECLRIPLVAGREFNDRDDESAGRVVIINENMAKRFWPGASPVGRSLRLWGGRIATVAGVVKSGRYRSLSEPARPFVYMCYLQGVPDLNLGVCLRAQGDPIGQIAALRRAVQALDRSVQVWANLPYTDFMQAAFLPARMATTMLMVLGAVAALLAAMGIYGVMAYAVSQRTHEIGVRMALGATIQDVLRLILSQGMTLALLGAGVGLLGSLVLTRLLGSFLYGVSPLDPVTFLGVAFLLGLVALAACYLPARRATRVDPMVALRYE